MNKENDFGQYLEGKPAYKIYTEYKKILSEGSKGILFGQKMSLYTEVKEWDNGYLVVMAKYKQNHNPEEEYIDLVPIIQNLYFDTENFLAPIKRVEVANA